jgi:hypothetical protein
MKETADQQTRRRWVTLAEVLAVAGVVIAGLTLYNSWQERRTGAAAKIEERAAAARDRTRFELRGVPADGHSSILLTRDEAHPLGDVRVTFPASLGVAPQDAVGHTIEADWFEGPLREQTDGGEDEVTGRLPVLVDYSFMADDKPIARRAIYDIVWKTEGRLLRSRRLSLVDFRLREAGGSRQRIDALWAKDRPKPPAK